MVRNFDHVTIVVRDVEAAKRFFAFLGFMEVKSVVISGKVMEDYMGVKGIEAEHVTLPSRTRTSKCSCCATATPKDCRRRHFEAQQARLQSRLLRRG